MEIPQYSTGFTEVFEDGSMLLLRKPIILTNQVETTLEPVKNGDDLLNISFRTMGSPLNWYIIAEINNIIDPFDFYDDGDNLIIPLLNG